MTEQNKESIINLSLVLYILGYLVVGIGGLSFQVQPAIGYVDSITNSNPPAGSTWVEDDSLHWADGNKEYFTAEGGILSAWKFSEGSGSTAYDDHRSKDGSINGATWTSGYYGSGLSFDGSNDYVDLPSVLEEPAPKTIALWVNPDTVSSSQRVIALRGSASILPFWIAENSNGYISTWQNGNYHRDIATISANTWTHFVAVDDGSQVRIYKNGNQVASFTSSPSAGSNYDSIGNDQGGMGSGWADYLDGHIDEVKVYSGSLNDQQVNEMYNKGRARFRATKGNYHFDSGSGSTAVDSSGWGNDGTINGATWTQGKRDDALSFDGSGDYVQATSSTSLNVDKITMTGWVRTDGSSTGNMLFNKEGLYEMAVGTSGISLAIAATGCSGWCNGWMAQDVGSISSNTWTHVATTWNGDVGRFYINGDLKQTVDPSEGDGNIQDSSRDLGIGARDVDNTPSAFFSGKIDEAKIYDRTLTEGEIQRIYEGSGSSPAGSSGSAWVEGSYLRFIDQKGLERVVGNTDTGANPTGAALGNLWMEGGQLRYIDENGNERVISE